MRKNRIMRLASAMLVFTIVTTCAISGTFAKYTTSTTGTDNARVAYWGFNQDAKTTIDLFDANYDNVKSENGDNVIAPGTAKTSTFAFGYDTNTKANAPEVAYDFTVNATITGNYTDLDSNSSFKWTLKDAEGTETEYAKAAELVDAIKKLSGSDTGTQRYEAGKLPEAFTAADETYTIGWKWAFEGSTDKDAQDTTDTNMGNATELENVNLTITITATQVD